MNTRIQILEELSHLAGARKHQFAAFCRQERCLVVWADDVETLIPSAEALEQRMISFVWEGRHRELADLDPGAETGGEYEDEKGALMRDSKEEEEGMGAGEGSWERRDKRPVMLYAPLISGLAIILTFVFIASGIRECSKVDRSWADIPGR